MNTENRKLIHTDVNYQQELQRQCNQAQEFVQDIVDAYNLIAVDNAALSSLKSSDLRLLIENPRELIFDKLTGGTLEVAGLKVTRERAIKMVEMPEGFELLEKEIADISQCKQGNFGESNQYLYVNRIYKYFTLCDKGQKVLISPETQNSIDQAGLHFAKSPKAIAMYEFTDEVVKLFKSKGLDQWFGGSGNNEGVILDIIKNTIQYCNIKEGTFMVNYRYLSSV